jgi:TonB family protein
MSQRNVRSYSSAFAQQDSGYFSRRSGTFFLVVSLHAILFYGVMTTLSHINAGVIPDPLQYRPLDDPHPPAVLPPPPPPQLSKATIDTPIPEFNVPGEPDPGHEVTTTSDTIPSQPLLQSNPIHEVKRTQGGPGVGFPDPDDFYPPLARRLEEQGSATVRVCVDAKGRLTSDPTVLQGSGSARLDDGALRLARAGSGHYRASTEDGQPVNSCYPFRIRFQIKN